MGGMARGRLARALERLQSAWLRPGSRPWLVCAKCQQRGSRRGMSHIYSPYTYACIQWAELSSCLHSVSLEGCGPASLAALGSALSGDGSAPVRVCVCLSCMARAVPLGAARRMRPGG